MNLPKQHRHHLHNNDGLASYGVKPLTGEADAYGRRLLCDLNEAGVILLTAYFGLSSTIEARHCFPRNWNSMVGEYPAVASVLLSRAIIPDLMVFALLHVGQFDYVMVSPSGYTGFNEGDKYGQHFLDGDAKGSNPEGWTLHRNFCKGSQAPTADGRNVHAMSGRVL
jgi:hypothetical protein